MLPLSRRIAVSANVVFSLYPTRNKVYLILSYLTSDLHCQNMFSKSFTYSYQIPENHTVAGHFIPADSTNIPQKQCELSQLFRTQLQRHIAWQHESGSSYTKWRASSTWRRHHMETSSVLLALFIKHMMLSWHGNAFSTILALCEGNP